MQVQHVWVMTAAVKPGGISTRSSSVVLQLSVTQHALHKRQSCPLVQHTVGVFQPNPPPSLTLPVCYVVLQVGVSVELPDHGV